MSQVTAMNAQPAPYLAAQWAEVRQRVDQACHAAGRDPSEVAVLPVSKTFGAEVVRQAVGLGLHRFGENKVQEIRAKAEVLADCGIDWVLIGHLQTNKARDVARLVAEVQSLDRWELAEALDRRLQAEGRAIDVLIQLKTAAEDSKYGLPPEQLPDLLERLKACHSLRPRGLMTLATQSDDPATVRGCFRSLREWRERMQQAGHTLPRLSMGMSGDYAAAIAEGATEVRIGTAIFGARSYPA
jgi:pyridoxal phosphate enzyme (YggS family)